MKKYRFKDKLIEGVIKSRPNRFIMFVETQGSVLKCHCPSTGRIGSISFNNIPCLLSKSKKSWRKTACTVEAISLDPPRKKEKEWIGTNQVEANRYVEFFLKNGMLGKMVGDGENVIRERKLGNSRIDFCVNNTYIEVKTLLMDLPCEGHPNYRKQSSRFIHFQRLINHFRELSKSLKRGKRAVVLLCYPYDAKPFKAPKPDRYSTGIENAARRAMAAGVENWQINLKVDEEGVSLINYFKLNIFQSE